MKLRTKSIIMAFAVVILLAGSIISIVLMKNGAKNGQMMAWNIRSDILFERNTKRRRSCVGGG